MKAQFAVEEEGFDETFDEKNEINLYNEFLQHIKVIWFSHAKMIIFVLYINVKLYLYLLNTNIDYNVT